ncbi:MAG: hypothetical protein AAF614_20100 [Chloroflexota bacterium]
MAKNNRIPLIIGLIIGLTTLARAFASPSFEVMRNVDVLLFIAGGMALGVALAAALVMIRSSR